MCLCRSIVLLQNKPGPSGSPLLPLKLSGAPKKIAIVGPHANATDAMRSNYCGANTRVLSNSPALAAMRKWAGKAQVSVVPGLNNTVGRPWDASGVAAAAAAAKAADIALVFVGLTPCQGKLAGPWYAPTCNEGESHDRKPQGCTSETCAACNRSARDQIHVVSLRLVPHCLVSEPLII